MNIINEPDQMYEVKLKNKSDDGCRFAIGNKYHERARIINPLPENVV